jgi:uncharacterized protein (DUF342 family)
MRVIHKLDDNIVLLELSASDDRMKLFIKVVPRAACNQASLEQVMSEIEKVTPKELIETDVVRDIVKELQEGRGCESRRVARGVQPEAGRDGKVVWLARRFSPTQSDPQEREFSDFFTLGLFENIEAGKEIARIYSPAAGTPGFDVLGKPVQAKGGRTATLRWDRSVELQTDPEHSNHTSVVALVSGYIHEESGLVSVRDTLQISGNLDWHTGHIDFVGSVRVGADVQKGFNIKARGGIEIAGSVLGENVLSSGKSLSIRGYHLGGPSYPVSAKDDYSVGLAQGVSVNAGGNIFIEREARDCNLRAGLAVIAGNAAIVGGTVWCVLGLQVDSLGNSAGVRTIVELRNELEVTREYRLLADSITKHEAALVALELHIGPYLKNRKRVPLLNNQFRAKITGLLERYDQVAVSLEKLRLQEKQMRESRPVPPEARISVSTMIHAGTILNSNDTTLEIKESIEGPVSFHRVNQQGEWVKDRYQAIKRG